MAKRKSTNTTSSNETEDKVDAPGVTDDSQSSKDTATDPETVAGAVDAVETYAPSEADKGSDTVASEGSDEVIELTEPGTKAADTDPVEEAAKVEADGDESSKGDVRDATEAEATDRPVADPVDVAEPAEPETVASETRTAPQAPQVIRETVVEHKGGFVPMLAGGALAAILGYGVAAYVSQDVWPFAGASEEDPFVSETRDALADQGATLSEVAGRVSALEGVEPPTVDLTPIETRLADVQDSVATVTARLDEFASRIETLEKQPFEQAVSPEAIAAYERALADLQAEVEAQRAEVAKMAQDAMQAEGNATEQAMLAAARAAMADVTAALETGSEFSGAVDVLALNGYDVPGALSAVAASGVATQVQLIESFPDAARAALSAVRSAETETAEGGNRIATFLANQLGARSVAPRDGDDADAILSRSEAALRSGDLGTAIAELSALPELAQSAMADWQDRAQTRLEAKTAADTLVQQLLQK